MAEPRGEAEDGDYYPPEDAGRDGSSTLASRSKFLSWVRTFDSLKYRDFRLLWAGSLFANAAQWLQLLTVGWLMLRLSGGDPALTGTVDGVRTLPALPIGPLGWRTGRPDRPAQAARSQPILPGNSSRIIRYLIEKSVRTHTIFTCCTAPPEYSTKSHDCMNFNHFLY